MTTSSYHQAGSSRMKLPIYVVAGVLFLMSIIGFFMSLNAEGPGQAALRLVGVVISSLFVLVSAFLVAWPTVVDWRLSAIADFPQEMDKVLSTMTDLEAVRREHYKLRGAFETATQEYRRYLGQAVETLTQIRAEFLDFAKLRQQLYEERQSKASLERTIDKWVEVAQGLCKAVERSLSHPDLSAEVRRAIEVFAEQLEKSLYSVGFDVIHPQRGDTFDDNLCEASRTENSADVSSHCVLECESWGYRYKGEVISRARVVLAYPQPSEKASVPLDEPDQGEGLTTRPPDSPLSSVEANAPPIETEDCCPERSMEVTSDVAPDREEV